MDKVETKLMCFDKVTRFVTLEPYQASLSGIVKILNDRYWDKKDTVSHAFISGSVGRGTVVASTSDVDMLFVLPDDVYKRFNRYESDGQSALLQEIKNLLLKTYPRTDMSGDGQVVRISFEKFNIDLVPCFEADGGCFKYPNTHNGGRWCICNPKAEQKEAVKYSKKTDGAYSFACRMLRIWREKEHVNAPGYLLDSIVASYFDACNFKSVIGVGGYNLFVESVFVYLSQIDSSRVSWPAPGSGHPITAPEAIRSIRWNAARVASRLSEAETGKQRDAVYSEVFGTSYNTAETKFDERQVAPNEVFVEDEYVVAINSLAEIDCDVAQDGFRTYPLHDWLSRFSNVGKLDIGRSLLFQLVKTGAYGTYEVRWKIRNVGPKAKQLSDERGTVLYQGSSHKERSRFEGPHYAECYIIKGDACVASRRIDVPIG